MMRLKTFTVIAALALTGCASFVTPSYSPDYATVDKLKNVPLRPVAVGEFQPRNPEAVVNKVTLRGAALAPASGTFAEYLENALRPISPN